MTDDIIRKTIHTQSIGSMADLTGHKKQDRLFNWNISPSDMTLLREIAKRAVMVFSRAQVEVTNPYGETGRLVINDDGAGLTMDIAAIHLNYRPLKLLSFLYSNDQDFIEEIVKISLCWNRKEGIMTHSQALKFAEET